MSDSFKVMSKNVYVGVQRLKPRSCNGYPNLNPTRNPNLGFGFGFGFAYLLKPEKSKNPNFHFFLFEDGRFFKEIF